jgi:creatinine amidohydrolase
MRWEHLSYKAFGPAVRDCAGVGVIPIGVIEPHSAHLPLGTDCFASHHIACEAAAREPALVLPSYPWGINHEGAHLPGSIVIERDLVFRLLQNVCDEMARHGVKKIVLLSGHGGNRYALPLFVQTLVEKERDYAVYYAQLPGFDGWKNLKEADDDGHAGEQETSMMLHLDADLVDMEAVPDPFTNQGSNAELKRAGAYSPVDWYAMYPNMYVGDAGKATAAKGKAVFDHSIDAFAKLLGAVKADEITAELLTRFREGVKAPTSPY